MAGYRIECEFYGSDADAQEFRTEVSVWAADRFGVASTRLIETDRQGRW
jgi:hypothetical protein